MLVVIVDIAVTNNNYSNNNSNSSDNGSNSNTGNNSSDRNNTISTGNGSSDSSSISNSNRVITETIQNTNLLRKQQGLILSDVVLSIASKYGYVATLHPQRFVYGVVYVEVYIISK